MPDIYLIFHVYLIETSMFLISKTVHLLLMHNFLNLYFL
nr:MAG TPA: hypothetical protein [Crassvirales sp.]